MGCARLRAEGVHGRALGCKGLLLHLAGLLGVDFGHQAAATFAHDLRVP